MVYLEIFMLNEQNMRVTFTVGLVAILGALAPICNVAAQAADDGVAPASTVDGTDVYSVCAPGDNNAALLVHVENIASVEGNLRAQVYSDKEEDFLEKGRKIVRVDVPVDADSQSVCVPLPATGNYSLVILHDKNSNGKADFFSEGFGFSNNPKLRFGPPDVEDAAFVASEGVTQMTINLQYILGTDDKKKKKRRSVRRR
jgi:uncharacterized protein (DUF2141 family)